MGKSVASCVEAWIEIARERSSMWRNSSLPAWKRGLKSQYNFKRFARCWVASCVEAWIEIVTSVDGANASPVASCVEAWIEIFLQLKKAPGSLVASCVEAWIEIDRTGEKRKMHLSLPAWTHRLE